jgi:hypothetical protein
MNSSSILKLNQSSEWNANGLCNDSQRPDSRVHFPTLDFAHSTPRKARFKVQAILTVTFRASHLRNMYAKILQEFIFFHLSDCRRTKKSFSSNRKVKFRKGNPISPRRGML